MCIRDRDLATAEMAIQAALTGHLVLSTLHTNDSPSAITRLLELGVPSYLISATVLGVMAQRLIRTLCVHCKEPDHIDDNTWNAFNQNKKIKLQTPYKPVGCNECRNTGYLGRVGLYEMLEVSSDMKKVIQPDSDLQTLRAQTTKEGILSLRDSGCLLYTSPSPRDLSTSRMPSSA